MIEDAIGSFERSPSSCQESGILPVGEELEPRTRLGDDDVFLSGDLPLLTLLLFAVRC